MRRLTSSIYGLWAAGMVANSLRLRRRLGRLAVLDDFLAGTGPGRPLFPVHGLDDEFRLLRAPGVAPDEMTLRAAVRFARFHDLAVVDLVPGDLSVTELVELISRVDPATYRDDRLAAGRGAGHATLVRREVLDRAGIDASRELDPVTYVETMLRLKRHAPTGTDLVIAPRLQAQEPDVAWRVPQLRATRYGAVGNVLAGLPGVTGALATVGPKLGRVGGVLAWAAYTAQPWILTSGVPVRPRDLSLVSSLGRSLRDVTSAARALRASTPQPVRQRADDQARAKDARRTRYADQDMSTLFEPPRITCPWCGDDDIAEMLTVGDLLQGKPGTFRLDECHGCGHIFQNPRLSLEGLDYYYGDFYDGLGAETADLVSAAGKVSYVGRAAMLQGVTTPKRWLDVGTGHGHFCLVAKELWPETRFDGLDLAASVAEAERRGWVEQGHRGLFPELAGDLTGAYDVVSMHHYLEHTREPEVELDAARRVLETGGHLLIEVPDPESKLGRKLGWLWGPWFQPQHQHLVSESNLTQALEQRGFSVVRVERGPAHQPVDLLFAMWLLVNRIAPAGDNPWSPRPSRAQRYARAATFTAFTPLLAGAYAADQLIAPILRQIPGATNAYRLLARKV